MLDLGTNLGIGFGVALSTTNLAYCFIGVTVGTLVGVLPGIGALTTIAMLLPITFGLDPIGGLIMLAGIYYGAVFGGSTTSILLNIPGTSATAVVCLDGHPMARAGRGGVALATAAISSFFGGTVATLFVALFAPALSNFALRFGAAEYFLLMTLGLLAAAALSSGSFLKSVAMVLLGLVLGIVGLDVNSGQARFTFGIPGLYEGLSFIVIAMAFFGFAEIVRNVAARPTASLIPRVPLRELMPRPRDLREAFPPMLRGLGLGSALGVLPGVGPTIASFFSYVLEKQVSARPETFGKGAIAGVAGPETSNNAAAQTSFIPTLTLGIPGDAVMALMLGALLIHGITPGVQAIQGNPELFWGLIASMWLGNLFLVVLNLPLVGLWVRLLSVPYNLLFPVVLVLLCLGVYSVRLAAFDLQLLALFGLVGVLTMRLGCPPAPMLLGLILGPMVEENFRRALLLGRGSFMPFIERPMCQAILILAALIAAALFAMQLGRRRAARETSP